MGSVVLGCPKIRGTFSGVPIIRIVICWGVCWRSPDLRNLPVLRGIRLRSFLFYSKKLFKHYFRNLHSKQLRVGAGIRLDRTEALRCTGNPTLQGAFVRPWGVPLGRESQAVYRFKDHGFRVWDISGVCTKDCAGILHENSYGATLSLLDLATSQ